MNNSSLKLGRNEIRLLKLKPRCYQHPQYDHERFHGVTLFCELEVASLQPRASYTALSYAWGIEVCNRSICIGDTIVNVSFTLEAALQELQDDEDDLMVWVDQLCINQEDEEEKGDQVKQMRNIYARATCVVAWIGSAADNSDLILEHLTSIGERAPKGMTPLNKRSFQHLLSRTFACVLPSLTNPQTLEAVSTGFQQFCRRSYWRRLWVIQEYSVARKVEIVCGHARISHLHLQRALDSIARLLYYLEDLGEEDSDDELVRNAHGIVKAYSATTSSFVEGIVTRRHKYQNSKSSRGDDTLFHVLISSLVLESDHNHPECTDPRDRIFAVLGLANDASSFEGFPDYTSKCEDVYTRATKQLLFQGHTDILSYCHFPRDSSLPSWVPDWRTMTFSPLAYDPWRDNLALKASGNTRQQLNITSTEHNLLNLSGTIIDTIRESGTLWSPNWLGNLDPQATLKYISEIEHFCTQSPRINTEETEIQTARIAIVDWDRAGGPNVGTDINAVDSCRRLRSSLAAATLSGVFAPIYDRDTWYRRAMQFLRPCRPFISSSGFVGLGPCDVEVGDVVCIFLGGLVPYVLRREPDGVYNLVGEAYVHGIMYGEHMRNNPVTTNITLR